jgi:UDP-galactopyranose mutase
MKKRDRLYDYLIVGAGLYGSVFAYHAKQRGKKCLVIDKRPHTGGNIHCESIEGINVHKYGPHIFHTSNKEVWRFVNAIADFNHFRYYPLANYKGRLYNLPFNMNTFYTLWGVKTPDEAKSRIEIQRKETGIANPRNLEEQAISLVGKDIYEILIKGYTEKQWGRKCTELPAFIIKRLPVRFTFDNNYFNDTCQGIPVGGYNKLTDGLLDGIEVKCDTDFFENREYFENIADKIIFTGKIDEFYNYRFGNLEYRTVRFETEVLDCENYQGNAAVNYTEFEIPYTRIIEHKHFEFGTQVKTVISREYPSEWQEGGEPFYPVNDKRNNTLYQQYKDLADKETKVMFGGRLAEYRYYDMDEIIENVINFCRNNKI